MKEGIEGGEWLEDGGDCGSYYDRHYFVSGADV
jgi:hypothetical protein